jgi:hypothetical protein
VGRTTVALGHVGAALLVAVAGCTRADNGLTAPDAQSDVALEASGPQSGDALTGPNGPQDWNCVY